MISIVIPLYNKEHAVKETLKSVNLQTFTDYEVLIINDGSTDGSLNVISDFICSIESTEERKKWRIINKDNGGVCSARNVGIKESQGEYIALLDGDDLWDRNYLQEQMRMVKDFPECGIWSINYAETRNGSIGYKVPTGLPDEFRGIVKDYFEMSGRVSDLCCSSSVLIRKEVFDRTGYFDERLRYAEDDDMWWRIIAEYKFAFYDRYMVFYRLDAENRALNTYRILSAFLACYPEKYAKYQQINPVFYQYIQRWCAIWLARYYFGTKKERQEARNAARRLDLSVISLKYTYMFLSPYPIGRLVWQLSNWKQKLKQR